MVVKLQIMTKNNPQNGGSVRVILSFLAFVVVCMYAPILVDELFLNDETAQQKIMRGADPTTILEATSSGGASSAIQCELRDYVFGRSSEGHLFMHNTNTRQYAVDISGVTRYFIVDRNSTVVREIAADSKQSVIDHQLASRMAECKKSGAVPTPVDISFLNQR